MKAIITGRKELPDSSLLLNVFTDLDEARKIKIPGILKSTRRSAYNMSPGALWDFTILGNPDKIQIPRESILISSPYARAADYDEMLLISDLLFPLTLLPDQFQPSDGIPRLFQVLSPVLESWDKIKYKFQIVDGWYFSFLYFSGVLNLNSSCPLCGNSSEESFFIPEHGIICTACSRKHIEWQNINIPVKYVVATLDYLQNPAGSEEKAAQLSEYLHYHEILRKTLKNILQH